MKRKGFTLIELLAVIIILAVIALIATPIVLNVVENARKSAFQQSAHGYYQAARYLYNEMYLEGNKQSVMFTFENGQQIASNGEYKLTVQGETPQGGLVYLSEDGYITVAIHNGKYCASTNGNGNVKITEDIENCMEQSVYADNSGANSPELVDKLIPVVYQNNEWKVVSPYEKWYNYNNKEWANAVILENGVTKNVGESLNIDTEVAQMYVWIPRYEYSVPEYNLGRTDSDIHAIDIKFVDSSITQTNADNGYNLHPGFKFGEQEVSGIWVGKFETTGENKENQTEFTCTDENCTQKVTIKPSYRASYGKVASQFYASRSIANQYDLSNLNSHMARYTEWTAVSYLTNSIYGRCSDATHCEEVTINNSGGIVSGAWQGGYTGNAGNSISDTKYGLEIYNAYNTIQGMKASTTGNITGIYDMSGGMWEYVMGVVTNVEELMINPGYFYDYSGFSATEGLGTEDLGNLPDKRYYDSFKTDGTETYLYDSLTAVNGVDGDYRGVFKELMTEDTYSTDINWYGDYARSVGAYSPWFLLGGYAGGSTNAGMFGSLNGDGSAVRSSGFRVVLAPGK